LLLGFFWKGTAGIAVVVVVVVVVPRAVARCKGPVKKKSVTPVVGGSEAKKGPRSDFLFFYGVF
jgi:hypothetical protein